MPEQPDTLLVDRDLIAALKPRDDAPGAVMAWADHVHDAMSELEELPTHYQEEMAKLHVLINDAAHKLADDPDDKEAHTEMLNNVKRIEMLILRVSTWKKVKAEPKPTAGQVFVYRNLRTDFDRKWIAKAGSEKEGSRFNESDLFYFWKLLLENVGNAIPYPTIADHVSKKRGEGGDRESPNIKKLMDNLVRKLHQVSKESQTAVREWFEDDGRSIRLKK